MIRSIRMGWLILLVLPFGMLITPGCAAIENGQSVGRSAQPNPERYEFARLLMGSRCRILVYASSESEAATASAAAFDRIAELDAVLSDYRDDSEASRLLRRTPGVWHPVSPDLARLLRISQDVHRASGGAFDPSVGPLTILWRQVRRTGQLPEPGVLAEARARSGLWMIEVDSDHDRVRFARSGMGLDFGGIGKGYAADEAMRVLRSAGFHRAMIDFDGDIVVGDPPAGQPEGWTVAIDDGRGRQRTVRLSNRAVTTSGDAEQSVEIDGVRYAHLIDPRRGLGLTRPVAATVIADSGTMADALASAACVLGPEKVGRLRAVYPDAVIEVVVGTNDRDSGTER